MNLDEIKAMLDGIPHDEFEWDWDKSEHNVWYEDDDTKRSYIMARVPEAGEDRWAHEQSVNIGVFIAASPYIVRDLVMRLEAIKDANEREGDGSSLSRAIDTILDDEWTAESE